MKRPTHSSHENAASLGTEDGTAGIEEIGENTGSAETGGLSRAQADATYPALGATTDVPQASNSLFLIPQPAKHLSAAAAVKKRVITRSNSSRGRFIK